MDKQEILKLIAEVQTNSAENFKWVFERLARLEAATVIEPRPDRLFSDLDTPVQPGHQAFFADGKSAERGVAVLHIDGWKVHPANALPDGVRMPTS